MTQWKFWLTAAIACFISQAAFGAAQPIHFELIDNRIFVDVLVNGSGPYKFIFDTGGNNSMTFELASKLHLNVTDAGAGTGVGPGSQRIGETNVESFQVGSIELKKQNFLVMDYSRIQKTFNLTALDGIFGFEILEKYLATIDFRRSELTFLLDGTGFDDRGFFEIPFELKANKPVIKASVDGQKANLLVDTGDRSALTITKKLRRFKKIENTFKAQSEIATGCGIGGIILAPLGRISRFNLPSSIELRDVIARGPTFKGGINSMAGVDASIGNGVLQQFDLAFDYRRNKVYLRKNGIFGQRTNFLPVPNPGACL